jgi:hypothetical protein
MADISIVKIKIRRGSDSDRQRVVLDEGELGFTTDTRRLYVGDGNTVGGVNIANLYLGQGTRSTFGTAVLGDLVYDVRENNLFALSATPPSLSANWANLGPKTDNTTVQYNSAFRLGLIDRCITRRYINAADIAFVGLSGAPDNTLTVDIDNNTIKFAANKIAVNPPAIGITALRNTGLGTDFTNLQVDGLLTFTVDDINGSGPNAAAYTAMNSRRVFLMNEPPFSSFYYLMVKP